MTLTVTDLFCGAGGSSIGAREIGLELRLGLNHWQRAIETHQANFPDADHDCADVSATDPRRYRRTDILLASPECTNHSTAKGVSRRKQELSLLDDGDPAAIRSRATMWDVVRFTERHRYRLVVVENVVDAYDWVLFQPWLGAMRALGYEQRCVFLNSQFAWPVPQSRDRMYVVFWPAGAPAPDLDFAPLAWCPACERHVAARQAWKRAERRWGRYGQQYLYRCPDCQAVTAPYAAAAANAIDWALPADRIGDRARPLRPATLERIQRGIRRLAEGGGDRLTTGLVVQVGGHTYERPGAARVSTTAEPFRTLTATADRGVALPPLMVAQRENGVPRTVGAPMQTVCAVNSMCVAAPPGMVVSNMAGNVPRVAGHEPMHCVTTGDRLYMLEPPAGFVVANYTPGWVRGLDEQLGSITTKDGHALVLPFKRNSDARPASDPLSTLTTSGAQALLVPYNRGAYEVARRVSAPLGTLTTRDRFGLVEGEAELELDDWTFRMLAVPEIGRAMAFADDYHVTGNRTEQKRQYGNAVTPPVMRDILAACVPSLEATS